MPVSVNYFGQAISQRVPWSAFFTGRAHGRKPSIMFEKAPSALTKDIGLHSSRVVFFYLPVQWLGHRSRLQKRKNNRPWNTLVERTQGPYWSAAFIYLPLPGFEPSRSRFE